MPGAALLSHAKLRSFMATRRLLISVLLLFVAIASAPAQSDTIAIFGVIRSNDLGALKILARDPQNIRAADRLGNTPLHYAALYGSAESVRILLDAKADPNAVNSQGATPLLLGSWDSSRALLMLKKGAKANVATHNGRTPLMVAVSTYGNSTTVKRLIESGAQVNAIDSEGSDALMAAASYADEDTIRLLLSHGADPKRTDKSGFTALLNTAYRRDDSRVKLLLDAGADPNAANTAGPTVKTGPLALVHIPTLQPAVVLAPQSVADLLRAGARVDEKDIRGVTPLMMAVADDHADLAVIRKLIAAKADVNARDKNGESVLDWALKYNNPEIVSALRASGAKEAAPWRAPSAFLGGFKRPTPAEALTRASELLAASSQGFFVASGCVGCHHQPMGARVYAAARDAGAPADERLKKLYLDGITAMRPTLQTRLAVLTELGGDNDPLLYNLSALADLKQPPSPDTDLLVHAMAVSQQPDGNWVASGGRSPLSEGSILLTSMAVRALATYGWEARADEFTARRQHGLQWLLTARAITNPERAERLMGLYYGGAEPEIVARAARDLSERQRPDGGWSPNPWLDSDAYATGIVLRALNVTGFVPVTSSVYSRGVDYLLRTQFPDGSWYVRSRAIKFQPYFESGFPFGHDQWISNAATAWAAMALAPLATPEAKSTEKKTTAALN